MSVHQSHRKHWPAATALFLGLFAIITLVHSLRSAIYPILAWEDGRDMLAFYYNNENPKSILRFYADYVSLIPNAIGWFAMRLPLPISPYVMTFASLLLATTGFFMLASDRYAWLIPQRPHRVALALLLAVLPLGKELMVNNLAYSQWSIFFILILLLARRPLPERWWGLSLWAVAVGLCAASHPISILVLPLCILQLIISKGVSQRAFVAIATGLLLAYQVLGIERETGASEVKPTIESAGWAFQVFLARVPFEAVFGPVLTTGLNRRGLTWAVFTGGAVILLITALLVYKSKRPTRDALITLLMLLFAYTVTAVSTLVRYIEPDERARHLEDTALQRYVYIPKLLFVILLFWLALPRFVRLWQRMRKTARIALLVVAVLYIAGNNLINRSLYDHNPKQGQRIRNFIAEVHEHEQRAKRGEPYQSRHTLGRGGWWDIVLDIDQHLGTDE